MRVILTAALSFFVLSGCMAQWETPVYDPAQRTALEGVPGVTCQQMKSGSGRLMDKPLCLNQSQWAARNPGRGNGGFYLAPLYPNNSTAQVHNGGSTYPGQNPPL